MEKSQKKILEGIVYYKFGEDVRGHKLDVQEGVSLSSYSPGGDRHYFFPQLSCEKGILMKEGVPFSMENSRGLKVKPIESINW